MTFSIKKATRSDIISYAEYCDDKAGIGEVPLTFEQFMRANEEIWGKL